MSLKRRKINYPKIKMKSSDMTKFYTSGKYIKKNPSLHKEDSPWKIEKIIPLVDLFLRDIDKKEINILDVGGGAGLILRGISSHIRKKGIKVKKYSLDLSPGMLKIQRENNSDIVKLLNEDIRKTSLKDKEIDLTLMIDVLEHVQNPQEALRELKRISKYVLFKVPLEDNLIVNLSNFLTRRKLRKDVIENFGHINVYNYESLKNQIENNGGEIVIAKFANVFEYFTESKRYEYKKDIKLIFKVYYALGNFLFKISPKFSAYAFNDFIMLLIKYPIKI